MKFTFLLFFLLMPVTGMATESPAECLTNKYLQYAKAQEMWQRELATLIVDVAPRYKEVAERYLKDQLRAIEQAKLAVTFLAREEQDKLRTHMTLNNWLNLEPGDHGRIASRDERYAQLLALDMAARERPPHPDGDGLREAMRSEVMASDQYSELLTAFQAAVQAAEEIQCE